VGGIAGTRMLVHMFSDHTKGQQSDNG